MKKCLGLLILGFAIWAMNRADAASLNAESLRALLEQSRQYEFGQSRRLLSEIENQIKAVYGTPEELLKAETLLLETLQSDCSLALKDFLCRQLSVIGSARSVPVLAALLKDSKTAALAQYALVRISSPEADKVLIDHLETADAAVRIGLLTSLGLRKSPMAVDAAARFAADEHPGVAEAALSALGQIGTLEAAAALEKRADQVAPTLRPRLYDALLACAENASKTGQTARAASIFRTIYQKNDLSELLRCAALQGLLCSLAPTEADSLMMEILEGKDAAFQTVCLLSACRLNRTAVLQKAQQMMPSMPAWQQVQFLTALGGAKSSAAKEAAVSALSSSSNEVVLAALDVLSMAGDASCLQPLAQTAARTSDRRIRQAAREALERLPDPQADSVIAELLQQADYSATDQSAYLAELIDAAGRRTARAALMPILKAAASENRSIRRAAFEALALMAEPKDIENMTFLLEKPDAEVVKVMVAAASKQSERKGRAKPFLGLLKTKDIQQKAALYQILGRLGDPDSLDLVREGLKSPDTRLQEAAFRGLTEWPGPEVMGDMKRWAAEGTTESQRVLAFRAYVRMVRQSDMPTDAKGSTLSDALTLAPRESEKKVVLSALAEVPCEQSLAAALGCLEQESIRPEAQAAVLSICRKLAFSQPSVCQDALKKLLETSPAEQTEKAARDLLKMIRPK
jgi:HEAT repeat protein